MKNIAIVGASGYAGQEALRLIDQHPEFTVSYLASARTETPPPPADAFDRPIEPLDIGRFADVDAVLLCTPHGISATLAHDALHAGAKVVDLSADFRLRDPQLYAATYGVEHPHPERLDDAIYGLTEVARDRVRDANLVANPGCYPTSILLPILPLRRHDLLQLDSASSPIIADSKSGVSGAGKNPSSRTHFGAVNDNFLAYGVGNHRHLPEIRQEAGTDQILFVPHLLPTFRGILSTIYLPVTPGTSADDVRSCLLETYASEPFVRVYPNGLPELQRVVGTNRCDVGVASAGSHVVVVSVIDNLLKGASGQALQNLNLMFGYDETLGLPR